MKYVLMNEAMPEAVSKNLSGHGIEFDVLPFPFAPDDLAKQLRSWAHHPTIIDFRTGLYNGRHLNFMLDTEINRCLRHKLEFSAIFMDCEFVAASPQVAISAEQQANVFRKLARLMKDSCRLIDLAFRSEYQEFAILLPQTPKNTAREKAVKLSKLVRSSFAIGQEERAPSLRTRIVVVSSPSDGTEKRELFAIVDQGVMALKNIGRGGIADADGIIASDVSP